MKPSGRSMHGFTIVELLVVIVVIGILATITLVVYNNITAKAADTSVQNDLQGMGQTLLANAAQSNTFPVDETTLSTQGLKVARGAYGNDLISGGIHYNALYCSTVSGYSPAGFAFVAAGKTGTVFAFRSNGGLSMYPAANWTGAGAGWGTICPDVLGVSAGNSNTGVWLYENSIWKSWLQ